MKNNRLKKWLPCQGYCQMNGAAAAVLSFKNTKVVFNGPRWCSVIAERELMAYNRNLTERLYCSHIEQTELLFGTGEKIREIIEHQQRENPNTSLLAVLTSCSVGLIGDDVHGIISTVEEIYPVIIMDAGGLTGLFEEGYQAVMLEILKKQQLKKSPACNPKKVNLLGYCAYYPHSRGDLTEMKRLLAEAGFELGVCLGESGLDLEELKQLPSASLNIVLSIELGLQTAKYLEEELGMEYAVLPTPYGFRQTRAWLKAIGEKLSVTPDLTNLESEISIMQDNMTEQIDGLKWMVKNLNYKKAILALPYTQAKSLANALQKEILEVEEVEYRVQGNYTGTDKEIAETKSWTEENICFSDENEYFPSDYQLLFGSSAERTLEGNYSRTIYLNMFKADSRIRQKYKTFVGIEGWGTLIQDVVDQTVTLYHLREERGNHHA